LPALSQAKAKAQGIGFLNNLKQMTLAWTMYAQDQNDRVLMNIGYFAQADWESWVRGWLTLDVPLGGPSPAPSAEQSTDVSYLLHSPLAAYGAVPRVWRCPTDKSIRTVKGVWQPRTRSFSMNEELGFYHPNRIPDGPPWVTDWMRRLAVKTTADVLNPGPAQCFVFLDEREDSIMDSHFFLPRMDFGTTNRPCIDWWVTPAITTTAPGTSALPMAIRNPTSGSTLAPSHAWCRTTTLSSRLKASPVRVIRMSNGSRSGRSKGTTEPRRQRNKKGARTLTAGN
jgi:hypothetical protein